MERDTYSEGFRNRERHPQYVFSPEQLVEILSDHINPKQIPTFQEETGVKLINALRNNEPVVDRITELLPTDIIPLTDTLPYVALGIRLAEDAYTGDKRDLLLVAANNDLEFARIKQAELQRSRTGNAHDLSLVGAGQDVVTKLGQVALIKREHPSSDALRARVNS